MNAWILSIAALYILIVLAIGVWASYRTHDSKDFYIAGRNLGLFVMAIAMFSSIQSGFGIVGGTSQVTDGGYGFISGVMVATPLGFALTWFLLGKRVVKIGRMDELYTIGDVAEFRYQSRAARGILALTVLLGVIGYLGTQVLAMGFVVAVIFDVSVTTGAILGMIILGIYVIGGGILAGVYTDFFQGTLMLVVSVIVFFYAIDSGGGIKSMMQTLHSENPELTSPWGLSPLIAIPCWIFLFSLGGSAQPHGLTKFLMLKEYKSLRWGSFVSGLAYAITTLMVIAIGTAVLVLTIRGEFPEIGSPDRAFTSYLTEYTPAPIAGLAIAGLLAAIMSTGSSFLTLGAASVVRDFPRTFKKAVTRELLWSRIAVGVLLVAATVFALYIGNLVAILGTFGWGTFAAGLFPALVLGLVWKRGTKAAAITSASISLILNFVLEVGGKYGFEPLPEGVIIGAFSFAVSLIVYIVISFLTPAATARDETPAELDAVLDGH